MKTDCLKLALILCTRYYIYRNKITMSTEENKEEMENVEREESIEELFRDLKAIMAKDDDALVSF